MVEIRNRIDLLVVEMNNKQIDRKELIDLLILALFSKHHIFLLGGPGVSKTGILEIFSTVIEQKTLFNVCIKDDTKYEELFGDRYRNEDGRLVYDLEGSIAKAHFALLDEVWKGNSKILNSLLAALSNYRKVSIAGKGMVKIPLLMAGAASNELPTDKEVRPLRDRFLFSYEVTPIKTEKDWIKFISRDYDRNPILKNTFTVEEIEFVNAQSKSVTIPSFINNLLFRIRQDVILFGIDVSERKFDGAIDVFLVSAFLNNRTEVDYSEIFILLHILWDKETDIQKIKEIVNNNVFGTLERVQVYVDDAEKNIKKIKSRLEGGLSDFIKFRRTYSHQEIDIFNSKLAEVENIIRDYGVLEKVLEDVYNHYLFNKDVEQKIADNKFVKNAHTPIYTDDIEDVFIILYLMWSDIKNIEDAKNMYNSILFSPNNIIEKFAIQTKSYIEKCKNISDQEIDNFLTKEGFNGFDSSIFGNFCVIIQKTINKYFEIDIALRQTKQEYDLFKMLYEEFEDKTISIRKIMKMKEDLKNDKNSLERWVSKYSELYEYNMQKTGT